jgi:hypothetical protein
MYSVSNLDGMRTTITHMYKATVDGALIGCQLIIIQPEVMSVTLRRMYHWVYLFRPIFNMSYVHTPFDSLMWKSKRTNASHKVCNYIQSIPNFQTTYDRSLYHFAQLCKPKFVHPLAKFRENLVLILCDVFNFE